MTRKTDDTPYGIAITAVGGGVGQSVLRALRISSLPLRTIGLDVSPWSAGLYACDRGYVVPHSSDESYADRLLEILTKESIQILIPGSDPEVSVISRVRDRFISKNIIPIVGSAEAVHLCRDKLSSYHFFKEHGIPFARTVATGDAFHLVRELGFPLILKPVGGSASRGTTVIFNEEQLKQQLEKGDKIVQEYLVPKRWGKRPRELTLQDVYNEMAERLEKTFESLRRNVESLRFDVETIDSLTKGDSLSSSDEIRNTLVKITNTRKEIEGEMSEFKV